MHGWVTAYTDASYQERGGWAVWLRSETGRVVRNGDCPDHVKDSMAAEIYAVLQAVLAEPIAPISEPVLESSSKASAANGDDRAPWESIV